MSEFKNIDFGHSSAEAESSISPELLLNGCIDPFDAVRKAESSHEFLFIGYKGSGKTAIARRIQLANMGRFDKFVNTMDLGDFPFTPFSKIIKGDAEPESKSPIAWGWLLLIRILDSFSFDNSILHPRPDLLQEAINALKEVGMIGNEDLSSVIKASSKNGFSIKIPKIFEYSKSTNGLIPDNTISFYVQSLIHLVNQCQSTNRHIIFIDGMDDIITKRSAQFSSLGGLFFEVNRLNEMFRKNDVSVKIICLCRTDIFEKIGGPNRNKIKQDFSVNIDWYHDSTNYNESMLISAANLRAKISLGRDVDIFEEFIVPKIRDVPNKKFILDHTRHTPRDFFQFLKQVQNFFPSRGKIEFSGFNSALKAYSQEYFLSEIRDELDGYLDTTEKEKIFAVIQRIGKREFQISELFDHAKIIGASDDLVTYAMERLYDCGAISNYQMANGSKLYAAKYRNRDSFFKSYQGISVHRALQKALNLV